MYLCLFIVIGHFPLIKQYSLFANALINVNVMQIIMLILNIEEDIREPSLLTRQLGVEFVGQPSEILRVWQILSLSIQCNRTNGKKRINVVLFQKQSYIAGTYVVTKNHIIPLPPFQNDICFPPIGYHTDWGKYIFFPALGIRFYHSSSPYWSFSPFLPHLFFSFLLFNPSFLFSFIISFLKIFLNDIPPPRGDKMENIYPCDIDLLF